MRACAHACPEISFVTKIYLERPEGVDSIVDEASEAGS